MALILKRIKSVLIALVASLRESYLKVTLFALGTIIFGYLCSVFFNIIRSFYLNEITFLQAFEIQRFDLNGILILLIVSTCLFAEAVFLGWNASSLKRILNTPSLSLRVDLFYFFLICAGITPVFGFLCSLGLGYAVNEFIRQHCNLNLLRNSNIFLQFCLVIPINSFIFYWHHRLFHTKLLWKFHEIHHAAEEFNLITNFRNHPIDITVRTIFYTLPAAILGINPLVLLIYSGLAGILTCFQHSELVWSMPFIEKHIFIGSSGHRIHHGRFFRQFNKNFGILVIWDKLFGTFDLTEAQPVQIGVQDHARIHNNGRPIQSLYKITISAFNNFFSLICETLQKKIKPDN
jgi:sterol desaturase/sphingolipid hydroxylase (fatty acid hydroxylase superfamily)